MPPVPAPAGPTPLAYAQRGTNTLQHVFRDHFGRFASEYDDRYAKELGNFRLERISRVTSRFLTCGDYRQGVARIRCSNPECRHEYFRAFSFKCFFLCPSCSQKRTLLFAQYLDERLLLALPHRQFVFTLPKALRVFLRHDQRLFAMLSRLIFSLIAEFYSAAARRAISTAAVMAYQPFGDSLRFNPHFHALILEGGFDSAGKFYHLPIHDTPRMADCLRRRTIGLFRKLGLITQPLAETLLCWKHSGFSVNNSVRLDGGDHKARQALIHCPCSPLPAEGDVRPRRGSGPLPLPISSRTPRFGTPRTSSPLSRNSSRRGAFAPSITTACTPPDARPGGSTCLTSCA